MEASEHARQKAWDDALSLHRAGRLREAAACYLKLLEFAPDSPPLLFQLGTLALQAGNLASALEWFNRSLRYDPDRPEALASRGWVLGALGRHAEALADYERALSLQPNQAGTHYNKGLTLKQTGRHREALASFEKSIELQPNHLKALVNRGNVLEMLDRPVEALASLERALTLEPQNIEIQNMRAGILRAMGQLEEALSALEKMLSLNPELAEVHNNRAGLLRDLGRFDEALESADKALSLNAGLAEAHNNRTTVLRDMGRLDEALESADRALSPNARLPEAYNNRAAVLCDLGCLDEALENADQALNLNARMADAHRTRGAILHKMKRFDAALSSLDRALTLNPRLVEAYNNRGILHQEMHRLEEAVADFDHAIQINPRYSEAFWNKCSTLLLAGRFTEGWPLYERRWRIRNFGIGTYLDTPQPLWSGQAVARLLVWAEQGIGDEVFFSSMLREARNRSGMLMVTVDSRLLPLMRRSFPDIRFFAKESTPPPEAYDAHLPMGSLPAIFRNSAGDFASSRSPYLKADPQRTAELRMSLMPSNRDGQSELVGISWRSVNKKSGAKRSISLRPLVETIRMAHPEARLVSLQYGEVGLELAQLGAECGEVVMQSAEVDNYKQLDDFAALLSACDKVVSIDNSTVHLAGALGVPTRVLLPYAPDWRWQLGRVDSPWYPSARLLRQPRHDDWEGVLTELGSDLVRTGDRE